MGTVNSNMPVQVKCRMDINVFAIVTGSSVSGSDMQAYCVFTRFRVDVPGIRIRGSSAVSKTPIIGQNRSCRHVRIPEMNMKRMLAVGLVFEFCITGSPDLYRFTVITGGAIGSGNMKANGVFPCLRINMPWIGIRGC
jgi:hypothetical protein